MWLGDTQAGKQHLTQEGWTLKWAWGPDIRTRTRTEQHPAGLGTLTLGWGHPHDRR